MIKINVNYIIYYPQNYSIIVFIAVFRYSLDNPIEYVYLLHSKWLTENEKEQNLQIRSAIFSHKSKIKKIFLKVIRDQRTMSLVHIGSKNRFANRTRSLEERKRKKLLKYGAVHLTHKDGSCKRISHLLAPPAMSPIFFFGVERVTPVIAPVAFWKIFFKYFFWKMHQQLICPFSFSRHRLWNSRKESVLFLLLHHGSCRFGELVRFGPNPLWLLSSSLIYSKYFLQSIKFITYK